MVDFGPKAKAIVEERDALFTFYPDLKYDTDVSQVYKQVLSPEEVAIVELDASSLAAAVAKGTYTAKQVVQAYVKSATVSHQTTNCHSWIDPAKALAQADELDKYYKENGKTVGPWHGVPISIKDSIKVKDWPFSGSTMKTMGKSDYDAQIAAILRKAGAIFLSRTSMPQSIMHLETDGYLGRVKNPYNTNLTPGGSTGGESALVSSRGSPIGIGTDIGGSIRCPSAFCGLWGFKPSASRPPQQGITDLFPGHESILSSCGPLARSFNDVELFLETVLNYDACVTDPLIPPLGWNKDVAKGNVKWKGGDKIRIGVLWQDGIVKPVAPVRRALDKVVADLKTRDDVEVVDFETKWQDQFFEVIRKLYFTDGAKQLREAIGDEPMLPMTEFIVSTSDELDQNELWKLVDQRNRFRIEYTKLTEDLDVILGPAFPTPATLPNTSKYWPYTAMYNLLDWPASVFPTGLRSEATDVEGEYTPRNAFEKEIYDNFDPKNHVNAPLNLQVACPRWHDEKLVAVLRVISEVVA